MATSTQSRTAKANTIFSLALFKKLIEEDKTANIFYSPFSISSALAMVMLGTRGYTAKQMSEVLGFTETGEPMETGQQQTQMCSTMQSQVQSQVQSQMQSQVQSLVQSQVQSLVQSQVLNPQNGDDDIHASFAKLLGELNKENAPYALSVANRLYGEKSYEFVKKFLDDTKKHYSAELESVDFKTSAEAARVNINIWVEEQTQGKIKDLLAKGVLDEMTRLVLVNAIYFKGHWNKQFQESDTRDAKFKVKKNDKKKVKMMRQESKFNYTDNIDEVNCQILEMPYDGKELSMLIFLPSEDDTTGLEKLESELTYENFMKWTGSDKMSETDVVVSLPRFKMEVTYALKDTLISMGMVNAFDVTRSDFSGMSPANDLMLSKVIHKAFVEVNEEGTEAAAATAAVISHRSVSIPVIFNADHPFLFFIRHNPTMTILFAGRYCSPE